MNDVAFLVATYERLTSLVYLESDSEVSLKASIVEVKRFLIAEAMFFGFRGFLVDIHSALYYTEFEPFATFEMLLYCRIMGYNTELYQNVKKKRYLAEYILVKTVRRLENFRADKFKLDVLFGHPTQRGLDMDLMIFHHADPVDEISILRNLEIYGIEHFMPRVGSLTNETLIDRYSFTDLIRIYRTNFEDKDWEFRTDLRPLDVASLIMLYVEKEAVDPRFLVTNNGMQDVTIREVTENTLSISDSSMVPKETLLEKYGSEGMFTYFTKRERSIMLNSAAEVDKYEKHPEILWEEYVVNQLSDAFSSHPGSHRDMGAAAYNLTMSNGSSVSDYTSREIVYYGPRDGFSPLRVYSLSELIEIFRSSGWFYRPDIVSDEAEVLNGIHFSLPSIKRLLHVVLPLVKTDESDQLQLVIRNILTTLKEDSVFYESQERRILEIMENIMTLDVPLRYAFIELRKMCELILTSDNIHHELHAQELQKIDEVSVRDVVPNSKDTTKFRDIISQSILDAIDKVADIQDKTGIGAFQRLFIWRHLYTDPFRPESEALVEEVHHESYKIDTYLEMMLKMSRYKLIKPLKVAAANMKVTVDTYENILMS